MGERTVRPVTTAADMNTWISFPRRHVYAPTSLWVPPLDRDVRRLLDTKKNPFFRHGTALALLAEDAHGNPCGRLLVHVYHRHSVRHGERAAFFGFFECQDDRATAAALFRAAADYGAQHGCSVLRGPFNMTAMQEMGLLQEGFADSPAVDETYSAPYYPALLAAVGLERTFPVTTFRLDDVATVDPDALLRAPHRALLDGGHLHIRAADFRHFDREIELLRELLNDSFYDNPYFVPISCEEFHFQIGPYRRLMDPGLCLVAELDHVPCGFIVAVPDFNPLLKRMAGSAGPRALTSFLMGRRHVHAASLLIMGVQRQLQGQGIMRVLQAEFLRALQRRRYRRLTITWIAGDNEKSLATVRAIGARSLHHLSLYEVAIPLASPRDRAAAPRKGDEQ